MTFFLELIAGVAFLAIIYFGFVKKSDVGRSTIPNSGPNNGPPNTAPPKYPSEGNK